MQIIWSLPAQRDLRRIEGWLTDEASPEIALRTLVAIRQRSTFLERFPRGGRPHGDGERIPRVFDTPYRIRYRVEATRVEVLRVHHEREDWFVPQ